MGSAIEESFADFLDSLKAAGVEISNESELRERLAEAQRWHYAFMTLARNGRAIGITFAGEADPMDTQIRDAFGRHHFPEQAVDLFVSHLDTRH